MGDIGYQTRIRELRKANQLTLAQVAERVGISPAFLQKLEVGSRSLLDYQARAIAEALNVPPADLYLPEEGGLSARERAIIDNYRSLTPELRTAFESFLANAGSPALSGESTQNGEGH